MYGRYGTDQLYIALAVIFIILQLFQLFAQNPLINIASLALIVWMFYRVFSKNITARQAENQRYLRLSKKVKTKTHLWFRKVKEIRTHRYRQCPECHTTLRLPRKRGSHTVRCPQCEHAFEVKITL